MIYIAICDDEKFYSQKIERQLKRIMLSYKEERYKIVTYSSGKELLEARVELCNYQIFFLDINMKELNGLDVAKKIREINKNAFIAFITAYIDYAMEGYKVEAIRFILKDMLDEMLKECMDSILQKLNVRTHKVEYNFLEGKKKINVDDILIVESKLHKAIFTVRSREDVQYSLYEKLDYIERELKEYGFLRIHKSYLINLKYICRVERYKVNLQSGQEFPIPREKYQMIEEKYYEYEGKML